MERQRFRYDRSDLAIVQAQPDLTSCLVWPCPALSAPVDVNNWCQPPGLTSAPSPNNTQEPDYLKLPYRPGLLTLQR